MSYGEFVAHPVLMPDPGVAASLGESENDSGMSLRFSFLPLRCLFLDLTFSRRGSKYRCFNASVADIRSSGLRQSSCFRSSIATGDARGSLCSSPFAIGSLEKHIG